MKRFFAASIVAGAALIAGIVAASGTADSQTILRGTRPAAPTAQQPAPLVCPDGSYNSDGLCRPYSWNSVTTGENELQFLYPLPPLER
jgi:hypothetical protein